MSNPHIQLETFGGHREDGVVNGDHSKDDATHPLLDEKKPSIWSRIHHASKIILSALPRPSHSRMLVMSWILCCLLLVLHILAVSRWPRGDYGIGILRESFDCGSGGTAFVTFFITIPMNGIATLLVYILGLVAKRSSLILKITAILMCVPTHLLYNSLFFPSTSAYDAYEVLVSNDFLHRNGTPFDLTTLQLRPTVGKFDPIQNDYNMSLPELNNLTISITALQTSIISNQKQLQWTNLTFSDCLKKYQAGTYDSFSNVILISNWTTSSNANNSALGLTILSGQTSPKHRIAQSLVSLCPESFFSAHNRTEPQEWDYIQSGANGLFDAYAPKNFSLKQENVFVESCFSQDIPQRCRLLYSPLVLKIATACLVVTLACVSLSIFFGHHGEIDTDSEITTKAALFIPGSAIVLVAFIIQFFLTAFSSVTELGPRSKSDQGWLLNAFCIINVVQLIDTICSDLFVFTHLPGHLYFPFGLLWHEFLSVVFSIQLSDRYMFSSSPPGYTILPGAALSSLWFEAMFRWLVKEAWSDLFLNEIDFIVILVLFCIPFPLRLGAQALIAKCA